MTETVWKYPIPRNALFDLQMPKGARVLDVQTQNGAGCMWALVNPDAPREVRRFEIVGTGNSMVQNDATGNRVYHGTWQEGSFVFHLFGHVPYGHLLDGRPV